MNEILHKIHTALEFVKDGQPFKINDLRLNLENEMITVTGWSQFINFENLTRDQIAKELEDIKLLFSKMIHVSPELKAFISDRKILYMLCFDDSGKVSIPLCSEINGVLTWDAEI